MALNPRGTRQRDGAAQLAQFQKENRLFDETSSSGVSPVFEVWNEPVVIHVHNLAPGQGVAVDCVSDYDSNPVYTPFTPVRGTPLILDEDLTSVILFYSGRYVLRLTGGGLGTIKAFCYPFSVSHDWGDYYASLGTGGNVVRSLDEIDTNTINITLNPDPGIGDVTIRADAILSPDPRNILEFRVNGMYARGPNNGNIEDAIVGANDTNTIDHTVTANILTSQVIRSPDANQILELRANGVYVPGPQNGNPANVPTSVLDTQSVDLTLAANVLSADVIISPDAGNSLELRANGLFSVGFAGTITTASDTNTIDHSVAMGVLSSQVIRSPDAGNLIELRANGVYSGVGNAVTSVTDTQSIDLTLAANNLQADLRIDPSAENVLNLGAPGVLVEAATTAEEEAESAGDLVITAAVLGHIVNARTASQSAHLGVNAGALTTGQVAVGYDAGSTNTGLNQITIGAFSGKGNSGQYNISIGHNAGINRTGESNILIGKDAGNNRPRNGTILLDPTGGAADHGDFSVLQGYQVLSGATGATGTITAIGRGAAASASLNDAYAPVAIGDGALGTFTQTRPGGFTNAQSPIAVGNGAGNFARAMSGMFIGASAGNNYCNKKTTLDEIITAIGNSAGASAFDESDIIGEQPKTAVFVGDGAGRQLVTYKANIPSEPVGEEIAWDYIGVGYNVGVRAEASELTAIGSGATFEAAALGVVAVGPFAAHHSAHFKSTMIGRRSGYYTTGQRCVFVGVDSGYDANNYTTNYSPNFTNAGINTSTNVITTGAHGKTVGSYITAYFSVVSGTAPQNLSEPTEAYVFYVDSATSVRSITPLATTGSGTFRLLFPDLVYDNITAIGYGAIGTANNQVTLGNSAVTQMRTAGKIYPGAPAGAFQSAAGMYGGTGAPNNAHGSDGDFYFRSDGGALTSIYHKRSGSWVGIV